MLPPLLNHSFNSKVPRIFFDLKKYTLELVPRMPNLKGMASLLQLPGEIRNQIYQYALVKAKPFIAKLQFFPHETALFRVNKQIYAEASTIFYSYNIFSFPQALFDGPPILEKLEDFIRLPLWRLAMLNNLKIDVPVSPNKIKIHLLAYQKC